MSSPETSSTPKASTSEIRLRMRNTKQRDTAPEMALRSLLHGMGLRYRVDYKALSDHRSRVDIAFPRRKVAVFVDGCFWHGCPQHGTWPTRNGSWWREKIQANKTRDTKTADALTAQGWVVIRVWEHEKPSDVAAAIESVVKSR